MIISNHSITLAGNKKESFHISGFKKLTGEEAIVIRNTIIACLANGHDIIYVNAKEVTEADLSGINEIIHTHYTLQRASKQLVFVYRKNTGVEKWVETTRLDSFIETAIIPAN